VRQLWDKYVVEMEMPIILARIDDRLIHGQITVAWSKVSNPEVIAVVSDRVASDAIQKSALELAVPVGIELAIYSVKQAVKQFNPDSPMIKKRIFVIAPTPNDFVDLIEGGVRVESINVGQMGFKQGKKRISRTLSVEEEDITALKKLHALGVALEHRQLPSDKKISLQKLLPEPL
jgi:mannose/fructose/sorbose-specific phosphotransferase system IIB component